VEIATQQTTELQDGSPTEAVALPLLLPLLGEEWEALGEHKEVQHVLQWLVEDEADSRCLVILPHRQPDRHRHRHRQTYMGTYQ